MNANKKGPRQGASENSNTTNITTVLRRFQRGTDCLIEVAGSIALGIWVGTVLIALARAVIA